MGESCLLYVLKISLSFCSLSLFYGQIAFEFSLHITERVGSNNDDDDANPTLVSDFLLISLGAPVQSLPPCKHLFSEKEQNAFFLQALHTVILK